MSPRRPTPLNKFFLLGLSIMLTCGLSRAETTPTPTVQHSDVKPENHAQDDKEKHEVINHIDSHADENSHSPDPMSKQGKFGSIKYSNKTPKVSHYHQTTAADLLANEKGLDHREPWQIIMRQADLAAESHDYEMAEGLYGHAFLLSPPEDARKRAYLKLANMYELAGEPAKMATMYEKFTHEFKEDPRLAQIFMRLGHLYREMGAYQMAISRFYNVLNVTLNIDTTGVESYKEISLQAQLDIAETHFIMGNFDEAEKFFRRLMFLDLDEDVRMNVRYKTSYLDYLQEDYGATATGLEEFLNLYPNSNYAPESHFMLSNAYNKLNQPREAVRQVLNLLKQRENILPENMEVWQYWRKRTANQLADQFYKQGDFLSAIKIYQAMARISNQPSWQWPVIYQIGLCFERLHMYAKAQEAYSILATGEEWKDMKFTMTPALTSIKDSAQWRLDHLKWNNDTKARVKDLLEIADRKELPSKLPLGEEDTPQATN